MGIVKKEDIVGYKTEDGKVFCSDCFFREESNRIDRKLESQLTENSPILESERNEGDYWFCSECKEEF